MSKSAAFSLLKNIPGVDLSAITYRTIIPGHSLSGLLLTAKSCRHFLVKALIIKSNLNSGGPKKTPGTSQFPVT